MPCYRHFPPQKKVPLIEAVISDLKSDHSARGMQQVWAKHVGVEYGVLEPGLSSHGNEGICLLLDNKRSLGVGYALHADPPATPDPLCVQASSLWEWWATVMVQGLR